ncbi:Fur family transcriptional regulator [Eubacterium sp. AB3007]|uniref:Fur family transcriptional regulator n=1 Tax=Eubacterium sp. AB3007 TaxID=1392487 RepID=UPI00068F344C|nr:transcriptional repressor [Eubacterium sp. AB3007]
MGKTYKTEGRKKIMDILRQSGGVPLSVPQIEGKLQEGGSPLNKTTIYRYLDKLEDSGDVVKYAGDEGRKALFQLVDRKHRCDQHLHLKCVECGALLHLDGPTMSTLAEQVYTEHGFMIQCRNSVIYGLCQECLKKEWMSD